MRLILSICLLCLTSLCQATSQDGGTVYVDKDGWVIGAGKSTPVKQDIFKQSKKDSMFLGDMLPKNNELKFPSKR